MNHENKKNIHTNNFDFLRIFAALSVLYSHHFALTGQPEPSFFGINTLGAGAVIVFFIISGYLIAASWINDPNFIRFTIRRALRIWPALILIVTATVFIIGPIFTTLPVKEYLKHPDSFNYLYAILLKIHFTLPGVFENSLFPQGINGSLWTIPLEVRCYVILAIMGLLGILKNKFIFLSVFSIYLAWFISTQSVDLHGIFQAKHELTAFFFTGSLMFFFKNFWERNTALTFSIVAITGTILIVLEFKYTSSLILLPFFTIYFGTRSYRFFTSFGKFGDPSYGIYLFSFPIQQIVITQYLNELGFTGTLLLSSFLSLLLGYISWHFFEKKVLKFKPSRK